MLMFFVQQNKGFPHITKSTQMHLFLTTYFSLYVEHNATVIFIPCSSRQRTLAAIIC